MLSAMERLEKGQKDLGEMGNRQLEERLLSRAISEVDECRFLSLKRSRNFLGGCLGEGGVVGGKEDDLGGEEQRELVRLMHLRRESMGIDSLRDCLINP